MQILLYRLTSPSGKQYIGQTVGTLAARFRKHCLKEGGCRAIHSAICKYGAENFKLEELGRVPEALANYAEARLIRTCKTLSPGGYNLVVDNPVCREYAPETLERKSRTMKARWNNPEFRPSMLEALAKGTAALHTPEVEARAAEAHRTDGFREAAGERLSSRWADPEARKKMSDAMAIVYASEGYRAAQSAARKKLCEDPEFRKRIAEPVTRPATRAKLAAIARSPEGRAVRSVLSKAAWKNPEYRAKTSASLSAVFSQEGTLRTKAIATLRHPETERLRLAAVKKRWEDPEFRAQQSIRMRAAWVKRRSKKEAAGVSGT